MKRGPLWDIGGYVKIDHAGNALSLVMGYTYAVQSQTTLYPLDSTRFSYSTVNSDAYYRGWRMHTLHVGAEYDLATETNAIGPRLGIFYNTVLSGQRIFTTGMLGGSLGLDIQWHW